MQRHPTARMQQKAASAQVQFFWSFRYKSFHLAGMNAKGICYCTTIDLQSADLQLLIKRPAEEPSSTQKSKVPDFGKKRRRETGKGKKDAVQTGYAVFIL